MLAELRHHPWVHLSCHGSQHVTDPTESAFWLTDGPLRISDLTEQHHPGPRELAFLSACQTATGSARVPDETIHLAAAMQLLGYRHVIATLWSIYDSPAPDIADTVYATLTATATPDANHAAHALHVFGKLFGPHQSSEIRLHLWISPEQPGRRKGSSRRFGWPAHVGRGGAQTRC